MGAAKINLAAIGGAALDEAVAPGFVPIGLDEDRADMLIHTCDHKAMAAVFPCRLLH